jgi:hypothetical protein
MPLLEQTEDTYIFAWSHKTGNLHGALFSVSFFGDLGKFPSSAAATIQPVKSEGKTNCSSSKATIS